MALETSASATFLESGMGTINGIKGIGLSSSTTLQVPISISGGLLTASGVIIGTPLAIIGVHYLVKKIWGEKNIKGGKGFSSTNNKLLLSMGVASTLMVSVGTAMLPRTQTIMLVHVIAGYTCIILSFIHIYQYRKVIKAQTKKFWQFLSAPKTAAKSNSKPRVRVKTKSKPKAVTKPPLQVISALPQKA